MSDLIVAPGRWWTADGEQPDEQLVIQPVGRSVPGSQPGRLKVTGWRHRDDQPAPERVTVEVAAGDVGWSSGPCGWPAGH